MEVGWWGGVGWRWGGVGGVGWRGWGGVGQGEVGWVGWGGGGVGWGCGGGWGEVVGWGGVGWEHSPAFRLELLAGRVVELLVPRRPPLPSLAARLPQPRPARVLGQDLGGRLACRHSFRPKRNRRPLVARGCPASLKD